jgi:hypothetical protein
MPFNAIKIPETSITRDRQVCLERLSFIFIANDHVVDMNFGRMALLKRHSMLTIAYSVSATMLRDLKLISVPEMIVWPFARVLARDLLSIFFSNFCIVFSVRFIWKSSRRFTQMGFSIWNIFKVNALCCSLTYSVCIFDD